MAQEAASAANGQATSPVLTVGGLIDTKAYGKLKSFDGKEEHWSTWSFVARSYFTLLSPDFANLIELAENQPSGTMRMHALSEPAQVHARTLYHILAQSVDGKALSVMMNVERQNGFEAWKALVDTYQPDLGGRHTSMLMGIISPSWEAVTEGDFLEALENWEVLVRRYQDQATDVVSNATKIAVLMKYSPSSLRGALRTNASMMGGDYDKVKKFIRDWLQSGVSYSSTGEVANPSAAHQGAAPMDVGAIGYDKKGAGKDKGKKGGKDYGKKGAGKDQDKKGGAATARFEGECGFCHKWGHKRRDCWARQQKGKGAGKGKPGGGGKTTAAVEGQSGSSMAAAPTTWTARRRTARRATPKPEQRWAGF